MICPICGKDHLNHFGTPGPVVTIGTNADKTYTSSDLAAAEERGRREGFSAGLRRAVDRMSGYMSRADSMLYDDDITALLAEKEPPYDGPKTSS